MTHNRSIKARNGFTIVELLVVIVVIGILAAITIVSFTAITESAKKKTVKTDALTIASQLNKYKADKGSYPTNLTELPSGTGINSTFQYTFDATAGTFCLTASVKGASAFVRSGSSATTEGGCPGHGINGESPITNLATNPSAETNISGVTGYNGATPGRTSGGAMSGTYTFSTTTSSAVSNQGLIHTVTTTAKPNQAYSCSIWLKGTSAAISFSGRPATAADGYISESLGIKTITLTSNWQRVAITFTTPATTGILRVQYRLVTATAGITIQSDALMCTEGDADYQFADGSSTNWMWNGTANISSSTGPAL